MKFWSTKYLKDLKDLNSAEPVHWGKPLRIHVSLFYKSTDIRTLGEVSTFFYLTSEVSVFGAHTSLTMGYHGPSADLLYPGVCVSLYLFGLTHAPD